MKFNGKNDESASVVLMKLKSEIDNEVAYMGENLFLCHNKYLVNALNPNDP